REWNYVKAERVYRGARYRIVYRRGEDKGIVVNGEKVTGNKIPIAPANTCCTVECFLPMSNDKNLRGV
ncbi:MAG: hypothetical protein ACI4SH_08775, partial [Candidatus Scatosoma sp.]